MNHVKKFLETEHKLNGTGQFQFAGNESNSNDLLKLNVGLTIDYGIYPYEFDFSSKTNAVLTNGEFQENVSDIDVSFDLHPFHLPDTSISDDHAGLGFENYVFLKRLNDDFLGINQRYEIGTGFIYNIYTGGLTETGEKHKKDLDKVSTIKNQDLIKFLETCTDAKNKLGLSTEECGTLRKMENVIKRTNKKQYSKVRAALLLGLYYEIDDAKAYNTIRFNNVDTLMTQSFETTNKLKVSIRPTFAWKPSDKYSFYCRSYFKFPFKITDKISAGNLMSEKKDIFIDLKASLNMKVDQDFTIGLEYRLLYDCAPKRIYLFETNGHPVLLTGQNHHSTFGLVLKYNF